MGEPIRFKSRGERAVDEARLVMTFEERVEWIRNKPSGYFDELHGELDRKGLWNTNPQENAMNFEEALHELLDRYASTDPGEIVSAMELALMAQRERKEEFDADDKIDE